MIMKEDDLQNSIEKGEIMPGMNEEDVASYELVFRALKKAPGHSLSQGFADKIIEAAQKKRKREAQRDNLWLVAGIVMILAGLVAFIIYIDFRIDVSMFRSVFDYKKLILLVIVLVAIIQVIDKKLVRSRHS